MAGIPNKAQMLKNLLEIEMIPPEDVLYIGDKFSDFIAADKNKISFEIIFYLEISKTLFG